MPTEIKTVLGLSLLSGAFIGVVEIVVATRCMARYEVWQRVGMLVCGIVTMVIVVWSALNIYVPEFVVCIIPKELLEMIRFKWYYIVNVIENLLFGVIFYGRSFGANAMVPAKIPLMRFPALSSCSCGNSATIDDAGDVSSSSSCGHT